jgi:hypothetical protein
MFDQYLKYVFGTIIFIVILNIIIQIAKSSSSVVKTAGIIGLLVCVFFLYKIFTWGEKAPEAPKETKTEGDKIWDR